MDYRLVDFATVSGSYRKFPVQVHWDMEAFKDLGVSVLSPASAEILYICNEFVSVRRDPVARVDNLSLSRIPEAFKVVEDSHLNAITRSDVLWLTMPGGYCGPATALEVGWALAHRVPVYSNAEDVYMSREPMVKAYVNHVKGIENLVGKTSLASVDIEVANRMLLEYGQLNASVAVGGIIRYEDKFLLVRTEKGGNRFSIVGDRIERGEELGNGLVRVVQEQAGLRGSRGRLISAASVLPDSGHRYGEVGRMFIDYEYLVRSQDVKLDRRASEYGWFTKSEVENRDDIEPNAKYAVLKSA